MLDRVVVGDVPRKHHIVLRGQDGALRYEECLTRQGFDGPYTIVYHVERPQTHRAAKAKHGFPLPVAADARALAKRHYVTPKLAPSKKPAIDARVPILFNEDVVVSIVKPGSADPVYFVNGDGDDLFFIHEGGGVLRSMLGDLRFTAGDYVAIPRGIATRFIPDDGAQTWLGLEGHGLSLLKQWRNETGQLRMDAPYSHRDFKRPQFQGPQDDGVRELVVKRNGAFHGFAIQHSMLDLVGWDGTVYPWAFPILNFQPRTGLVHLPPDWHGTFAFERALVCSFVPRLVDYHPEAIPCPYPHSSYDCDEILYYVSGNFTSRRGVGPGSISHHPAGIAHGPHPGSYEASIGTTRTDELAVMMDTLAPLHATKPALEIEDAGYQDSFL